MNLLDLFDNPKSAPAETNLVTLWASRGIGASSVYGGYPVVNALGEDHSTGTYWCSAGTGGGDWVTLGFSESLNVEKILLHLYGRPVAKILGGSNPDSPVIFDGSQPQQGRHGQQALTEYVLTRKGVFTDEIRIAFTEGAGTWAGVYNCAIVGTKFRRSTLSENIEELWKGEEAEKRLLECISPNLDALSDLHVTLLSDDERRTTFRCFRSLFEACGGHAPPSADATDVVSLKIPMPFTELLSFDECDLIRFLFETQRVGNLLTSSPETLLHLSLLLEILGLRKALLSLCCEVQGVEGIELRLIVELFQTCFEKYENPDASEQGFAHGITVALFNRMKRDKSECSKLASRWLQRHYLFALLVEEEPQNLHSFLGFPDFIPFSSPLGLLHQHLQFGSMVPNGVLISKFDGERVPAIVEMMAISYNFMRGALVFGGTEMTSFLEKREIVVEGLSGKALSDLVEFSMKGTIPDIKSRPLGDLFMLLVHAEAYFELPLLAFVEESIGELDTSHFLFPESLSSAAHFLGHCRTRDRILLKWSDQGHHSLSALRRICRSAFVPDDSSSRKMVASIGIVSKLRCDVRRLKSENWRLKEILASVMRRLKMPLPEDLLEDNSDEDEEEGVCEEEEEEGAKDS